MKKKILYVMLLIVLGLSFLSIGVYAGLDDHSSVSGYAITGVIQPDATTIIVTAQCEFCPACYPNDENAPGCDPFEPGDPWVLGPGYHDCGIGRPDGRFAAVRIISGMGYFDVTQKLVTNQANWPLGSLIAHNFVFTGLTLDPLDTITAYADFYCSWCYHWYAAPQTIVPVEPEEGEATIVSKTEDAAWYDWGEQITVTIEVDTTLSSQLVTVDTSLIDPSATVQDWTSWTGMIYPGPDPITQYLDVPASGVPGTWEIYVVVTDSGGQYEDSETNRIQVGIPSQVIPEIPLGTISAMLTCLAAVGARMRFRKP